MKICSHGWKGFPLFRDCFLFIVKFSVIWFSFYALVLCTWSYSNFLFIINLNSATLLPCFGLISSVPSGHFRICKGLREIMLRSNLSFSLESSCPFCPWSPTPIHLPFQHYTLHLSWFSFHLALVCAINAWCQ